MVVDANSASPPLPGVTYYGVEATHSQMCKFSSTRAPGFNILAATLRQWILDGPRLIRRRWFVEDQETRTRMVSEVQERVAELIESAVRLPACLLQRDGL